MPQFVQIQNEDGRWELVRVNDGAQERGMKRMVKMPVERVAEFLNTKCSYVTGRGKQGDLYGLELELEGRNVGMGGKAVKGWTQAADGSLRGESIEYVFTSPTNYEESINRVNRLFEQFLEEKVLLRNSYRCSTHVHVNFGDKKIRDVVNFFCLFTLVEELLEVYCGEARNGNMHCLSNREVEPIVRILEQSINSMNLGGFGNNIRYCAVNLAALNKFGSIEIRTMRGADNAEMVTDWLKMIKEMMDYTLNKMKSPVELIESLSFDGVDAFLAKVFSEESLAKLMAAWDEHGGNLNNSIYEGVRLVQLLAYRLNEAFLMEPVKKEEKSKKAAKQAAIVVDDWREEAAGWRIADRIVLDRVVEEEIPESLLERDLVRWEDDLEAFVLYYKEIPPALRLAPNQRMLENQMVVSMTTYPPYVPGHAGRFLYDFNENAFLDIGTGNYIHWLVPGAN